MTKEKFASLDFYGKLKYALGICGEIKRKLEKVGNRYAAEEYINELMDDTIENFNIFINDVNLLNEENFQEDTKSLRKLMSEVLEIAPLIKIYKADYKFLIYMIKSLLDILEERLPNNVRLAHFFRELLNYKDEFTDVMDISAEEIEKVIGNMLEHVDEVNDIIDGNQRKKKVKNKTYFV